MPYGITDPNELPTKPPMQIEAFYKAFPELRMKRYILFLARFHEKKGCDLLVNAYLQVMKNSHEIIDLVMAGPDPNGIAKNLQKIVHHSDVSQRVHWVGELRGDVKWGALRACEVYALPSHQENFGISVVESLSVGRPVLISDQVNIFNEISEDKSGFIDHDTMQGTINTLNQWMNLTEKDRCEMGDRARRTYLQRYAMSRTAQAINELFSEKTLHQESTSCAHVASV